MVRVLFLVLILVVGLPVVLVGCLREQPPLITSFMLQSPVKPVEYQWVPKEEIAEVARKAVIASEDQKFHSHSGFDYEAIEKAYRDNRTRNRKRGASTISQQTAKNLFLWPGGGYVRKAIEAYFTVLIEGIWPKHRILEVYLNIVEFGPGIYGVEAASQRFFGKSASKLLPAEAARLAAVLPNPKRWSAETPGPYVQARTAWILRQMGYAPRPPSVPDPEPIEPDVSEPAQGGATPESGHVIEDGDTTSPDESRESESEAAPTDDGLGPGQDQPRDAESADPVSRLEPSQETVTPSAGQQPRPRGGGSVIEETPTEGEGVWEQSQIL